MKTYKFLSLITICGAILSLSACSDNGKPGGLSKSSEGEIIWQSESIGGNLESAPAIDDEGNVYVIGGGSVYSFERKGNKRWNTFVDAVDFNAPSVSPDNKTVYCGGSDGLYALDAASGTIRWKSGGFPAGFHSVPAVSPDNSCIYIGIGAERDEGDNFYCFDAEDGNVTWEYNMPHEAYGFHGYIGGAIVDGAGIIYLSSQHGWLISLKDNGNSCSENWACNIGAEMRMPPSMDAAGFLYVGDSEKGQIHKVDSKTGIEEKGNWPVSVNTKSNDIGEVFANIAIAEDGTVYANSEDQRLWAINPDGTVKWNNLLFESWGSDPLIRDDGKLIVASQIDSAARVTCIRDDGKKGVIEWTSEPVTTTLFLNETNVNIADDGTIYVHSGDRGTLSILALRGNGNGLSKSAQWPKYMSNIKNNGALKTR